MLYNVSSIHRLTAQVTLPAAQNVALLVLYKRDLMEYVNVKLLADLHTNIQRQAH